MPGISHISDSLTSRSFLYGLGAGLSVYALLAGWAYFGGSTALKDKQERLASQTLMIEHMPSVRPEKIPVAELKNSDRVAALEPYEKDSAQDVTEPHAETAHSSPADKNVTDMRAAPYPGIYETGARGGILPIIRANDGLTSFYAYRKPFALAPEQKLIALVIDDYGLSRSQSTEAINVLPGEVTFILSPYAGDPNAMREMARGKGHELWLKLPMETQNFPKDDPGSKAILSRVSLDTNMDNLRWALSRTSGYAGLAIYNDLAFSRTKSTLSAILKAAADRGLGLFDLNISAPAQIQDTAERLNAPYISNEILFHDPKWNGEINEAAELLETIAESRGSGVGVFKNYPAALAFIENWLPELQRKGFTLAPLSAIYLSQNPEDRKPMPPVHEGSNESSH